MVFYWRGHRFVPLYQKKHVLIHFTPDGVKWNDLTPYAWNELAGNTWEAPIEPEEGAE